MKQSTNTWYAMEQKIDAEGNESSKAEIFIYDEIGGYEVNANTFIGQLEALEGIEQIDLRISSPGGSIVEGNVIFNAIKRHPANVTVYIDGMAASMASVIAMAGDEVLMADNALLMIHNPWTVSIGDSEQLRKDADLMDKMKSAIINAYSRSNYSTEELEELMDSTTWFTADEAFEAGFIDGTVEGLKAAATLSEMETIAKQAGATLPVEKIVSSIVAKNDAKVQPFPKWKQLQNRLAQHFQLKRLFQALLLKMMQKLLCLKIKFKVLKLRLMNIQPKLKNCKILQKTLLLKRKSWKRITNQSLKHHKKLQRKLYLALRLS